MGEVARLDRGDGRYRPRGRRSRVYEEKFDLAKKGTTGTADESRDGEDYAWSNYRRRASAVEVASVRERVRVRVTALASIQRRRASQLAPFFVGLTQLYVT